MQCWRLCPLLLAPPSVALGFSANLCSLRSTITKLLLCLTWWLLKGCYRFFDLCVPFFVSARASHHASMEAPFPSCDDCVVPHAAWLCIWSLLFPHCHFQLRMSPHCCDGLVCVTAYKIACRIFQKNSDQKKVNRILFWESQLESK